ncbi:BCN_G0000860.mRNA.1.CDS.1 [Saccharomyces cerevisiae]|nr:BCN_G0000860.mRNA.1.CDS.1 [Saccharomyces cerevisiae]CAI7035856.1 BCN_G0000860.mRNA.1.CDS.1 [Saccharomyces cerevisiae]
MKPSLSSENTYNSHYCHDYNSAMERHLLPLHPTEMTTVTGTNGLPTDETIIVIRTPTTATTAMTTTRAMERHFTSTSTEDDHRHRYQRFAN